MTLRKPKEKKSRLKDLKDLLETLPGIPKEESKKEIPDSLREWLKKNRPKIKPKKEIPDWFKEFLEKNRPDLWKTKPVPLPEMLPDPDRIKPVPLPEMLPDPDRIKPVPLPEIDPRFLWPPEGWKEDPRYKPSPMPTWPPEGWKKDPRYKRPSPMPDEFLWPPREPQPFKPPRFDPKRGIDPRYLLEAGDSEELIEVFDTETNQNVFISKDKLLEDEGRYSPIRKAGGGIMDIDRMTAPLGYDNGGDVDLAKIMTDMKASRGPAEVTHPIQKIISDRTLVDPYSESQKERLKKLGSKAKTGIETLKKLGSGAMDIGQELLGAGSVEASEVGLTETLRLLKLQLMLEKGMPGSVLMPSGDPNKIKRLEDKIQQIEIELGE